MTTGRATRCALPTAVAPILLVAFAASFLLGGCAAIKQRGARLLGEPTQGGLVVLDCTFTPLYDVGSREAGVDYLLETGMFKLPGNEALDEVAIEQTDKPGTYVYGTRFADLVVFPGLAPGTYSLRSLGHRRFLIEHLKDTDVYFDKRVFPFGGSTGNQITFTVGTGSLGYVGGVDIEARYVIEDMPRGEFMSARGLIQFTGENQSWTARVNYGAVRERDAWAKLLRMSEGTAWADAIIARIEELNSGGSSRDLPQP